MIFIRSSDRLAKSPFNLVTLFFKTVKAPSEYHNGRNVKKTKETEEILSGFDRAFTVHGVFKLLQTVPKKEVIYYSVTRFFLYKFDQTIF